MHARMAATIIAPLAAALVLAPAAAVVGYVTGVESLRAQVEWVTLIGTLVSYAVTLIAAVSVIPRLRASGRVRRSQYAITGATIGFVLPTAVGAASLTAGATSLRDVAITAAFGLIAGSAVAAAFWTIEGHFASHRPEPG